MKDNKVNVDLIVPAIGEKYNIYIPVNKTVGEVIQILNNMIDDLSGCFPLNNSLALFDVIDNKFYEIDTEIINSGIKNGTVLALM